MPLAGLPVGVKDVIDVAGFASGCGSRAGNNRAAKALVADFVSLLRAVGAVPVAKTVTTEFAFVDPSPTRNPYRLTHTPGGSSSGSAAAVAAGFVPLALGRAVPKARRGIYESANAQAARHSDEIASAGRAQVEQNVQRASLRCLDPDVDRDRIVDTALVHHLAIRFADLSREVDGPTGTRPWQKLPSRSAMIGKLERVRGQRLVEALVAHPTPPVR
jgi:Amidase